MDKLVKAINHTKEFSIVTCVTTDIMKEVVNRQQLVTGFSNVVSDVISANVLMSAVMKDEREEVAISLRTDGMISNVMSVGDFQGNFVGYGTLNNQSAKRILGAGVLEVVKYFDGKELRSSQTEVTSTNVSDIIVDYYFQSEQVYSVVLLASLSDKKTNEFYGSGGILIQLLPNASEEIKDKIAEVVANIEELSKKIALGMSAEELVKLIDEEASVLETRELNYLCKCSYENTLESLKLMDINEIKKIIEEDGGLTVICNACNKPYQYKLEDFITS